MPGREAAALDPARKGTAGTVRRARALAPAQWRSPPAWDLALPGRERALEGLGLTRALRVGTGMARGVGGRGLERSVGVKVWQCGWLS